MTDLTVSEQRFRSAIKGVESEMKAITVGYERIIDAVNRAADSVANWVTGFVDDLWELVKAGLAKLDKLVKDTFRILSALMQRTTPVLPLFRAALEWSTHVQGPVSGQGGVLKKSQADLTGNWQGPAAKVFEDRKTQQMLAVNATAAASDSVGKWLVKVAKLNSDFMVGVFRPLPVLAGRLSEVAVNALSVFGAIEAIDTAAELFGDVLRALGSLIADKANYATSLAAELHEANSILNNNVGFEGRHWPQMVGELSATY